MTENRRGKDVNFKKGLSVRGGDVVVSFAVLPNGGLRFFGSRHSNDAVFGVKRRVIVPGTGRPKNSGQNWR
jgi:hypothetical protein